jgi:large subunit ribosomal protein L7/L12
MSMNKAEILEAISQLSLVEVTELVSDFEKRFGVSAAVATVPLQTSGGPTPAPAPVEVQTEFSVALVAYPADKKVAVIKVVREITSLGLKEAKELVEQSTAGDARIPLKESITKADAEAIQKKLEEVGAKVEIQ